MSTGKRPGICCCSRNRPHLQPLERDIGLARADLVAGETEAEAEDFCFLFWGGDNVSKLLFIDSFLHARSYNPLVRGAG
jgi:hypothetical protein